MRIAFVGGCHIGEGGVHSQSAFPSVAVECLAKAGIDCTEVRLGPLPLSHPERLREFSKEHTPDIVVLQMGHFELSRSMSAHVFGPLVKRSHSSPPLPSLECTLQKTPVWRFQMWWKVILDRISGRTLIDFNEFGAKFDHFMKQAAGLKVRLVLVLSPLACADPVAMYYRRRARPL